MSHDPSVWLRLLMCGASLIASSQRAVAAGEELGRPNVVTFLLDDLDLESLNSLLAQGLLPNIQSHLINRGLRFDNHYATNPICAPSRATLLTGQYPKNHKVKSLSPGYVDAWVPEGQPTVQGEMTALPVALQARGYYTGHIGKYLNGYETNVPEQYVPPGYDFWAGLRGQLAYQVYNYEVNFNGKLLKYPADDAAYQTDVLARYAEGFIASAGSRAFALTVAPIPPHFEVFPVQSIVELFESGADGSSHFDETVRPAPRHLTKVDSLPGPSSFSKPSFGDYRGIDDKPLYVTLKEPLTPTDVEMASRGYRQRLASMLAVDDLVGRVVAKLGPRLANTYLILVSDNGYLFGEHKLSAKAVAYEESSHIPLIISGPGIKGGARSAKLVTTNDIAPTIASLTGATALREVDGRSLAPLLKDPNASWARRQMMIEHYEDSPIPGTVLDLSPALKDLYVHNQIFEFKAIRRIVPGQNLLYVEWHEDLYDKTKVTFRELYDLTSDPYQLANLALVPSYASLLASFAPLLQDFANCRGSSCVAVEDR